MDDLRGVLCLVGLAALCACGGPDEFDDQRGFRDGTIQPPTGGWLNNGIEDPDVSDIDPAHALGSPEGLAPEPSWLASAENLETARYLVECALPAGESIAKRVSGRTIVLDGLLGLAPEWKDEACDEDCQEWVSACLLARTNVSGESVSIFVAGDHEALGLVAPEGTVLEAAFYGNLFADPEEKFLCRGSQAGAIAARLDGRTCSVSGNCGFTRYDSRTEQSRCTADGPNGDVPTNCQTGLFPSSEPYHTLATYVAK